MPVLPRVPFPTGALRPIRRQCIPDFLPKPALSHPVDEHNARNPLFLGTPHHPVEVLHLKAQHLVG